MDTISVELRVGNEAIECAARCAMNGLLWCVHIENTPVGSVRCIATDVFEALMQIRVVLDHHDILVLCNGARRDAWPSSMARDMGGGRRVYVTAIGRRACFPTDLVATFDRAPSESVSTVPAQLDFHRRWLESNGFFDAIPGALPVAAKLHPYQPVCRIDSSYEGPDTEVPIEAIVGWWKVNERGTLAGEFEPNPRYRPNGGDANSRGGNPIADQCSSWPKRTLLKRSSGLTL